MMLRAFTRAVGFDPSGLILWDKQANTISPDDSDATTVATLQANSAVTGASGGRAWTGAKTWNGDYPWSASPPNDGEIDPLGIGGESCGYIYTVNPGDVAAFGGVIPGFVARAYAIEGWMAACAGQGDYYLDWGGVAGCLPGDIWMQFWYLQESAPWNLQSHHNGKLIYACRGPYGCAAIDYDWMIGRTFAHGEPFGTDPGTPWPDKFLSFRHSGVIDGNPIMQYPKGGSDIWSYIGQSSLAKTLGPGGWRCVRLHMNTSEAAQLGGYSTLEAWIRSYGEPSFTKIAGWVNGQSPDPDIDSGAYDLSYYLNGAAYGYGHGRVIIPANTDATGLFTPWAPLTSYNGQSVIAMTSPQVNRLFTNTIAGTSGASEPSWNNTLGSTTVDGSIEWVCEKIFATNNRFFLSDIAWAKGTDNGGPGVSSLPTFAHYGY